MRKLFTSAFLLLASTLSLAATLDPGGSQNPRCVAPTLKNDIPSASFSNGESVDFDADWGIIGGACESQDLNHVWSSTNMPSWLSLDTETGRFTGTAPSNAEFPNFSITLTNDLGSVTDTFTITVGTLLTGWEYGMVAADPAIAWGYDPRTIAVPADPASWSTSPTTATAGNYYIHNTTGCTTPSSLTDYGHPDAPLCGPMDNVTWGEGANIKIVGDGASYDTAGDSRWQWSCAGTTANPVFMHSPSAAPPEFLDRVDLGRGGPGCDHLVIDNVSWAVTNRGLQIHDSVSSSYITYRNTVIQGDSAFGSGAQIGLAGPSAADPSHHVMLYNLTVSDVGDYQTTSSTDHHFVKTANYVNDVYMVDTTLTRIQADCIQIGDASLNADGHPQRTFVLGNSCTNTGENWLDVKDAYGVIAAFNIAHTFLNRSSSNGECVAIHDEANHVYLIGNELSNCYRGIYASSEGNVHLMANVIRDLAGTIDYAAPYHEDNTGIYFRGIDTATASYNTCHGIKLCIQITSGMSGTLEVVGNIFGDRSDSASWDLSVEITGTATSGIFDNNLYADANPRMRVSGSDYTSLSGWVSGTNNGDNSIANSSPLFTNEVGDDFSLQATSPAVDEGYSAKPSFLSGYNTIFGVEPDVDLLMNSRPAAAGDWDMGAYERQ